MRECIQALIQENAKPTHCGQQDIHRGLIPSAELLTAINNQVATYRSQLMTIELAPHDPALDGKVERLHQTLTSMEHEAAELLGCIRRLATSATQWSRYVAETEADVIRYDERKAAADAGESAAPALA